jgi:hypothetical protein
MNPRNKVTGELSSITTYDPVTGEITGLVPIGNTTLGGNANVFITGGGPGEVLTTDGLGNLSWSTAGGSYSNVEANAFMAAGLVGNVTPAGNNIFSLGNATNQWKDLWVSNSTIYLNSIPLSVNAANVLTVGNANVVTTSPAGTTATVGVLTVTGNIVSNTGYYFLGDGGLLGNLPVQPGTYSNANVANYLPTYTGNISVGNAAITGQVTANTISLGAGNLSLTGNKLATTADTITIDPLNDGTNAGNVIVAGNLTVGGTLTFNNTVSATTDDLQWIAANNAGSPALATGAGLSVGPTGSYASFTFNAGANAWQSSLPIIANGGVNANGALSGATTGTFTGNVTAPFFIGNGSALTGLYANTNVANYLPTYTGNVGAGNVATSGNVTAARFIGDGSSLTNLPIQDGTYSNANVTSFLPTYLPTYLSTYLSTYTGNVGAGNVTATGRITTVNFTSTGNSTLGSNANVIITGGTGGQVLTTNGAGALTWTTPDGTYTNANVAAYLPTYTGNIAAGNVTTTGKVTATGNIQAAFFIGNGSQLTGLPSGYSNANVAAYLPTYTGNISAGNVTTTANVEAAFFIGDGSQLTGLPSGYSNANVAAYLPTYTGNVAAGNVIAADNVQAAFFIGDGSQLTDLPVQPGTYTNANVAAYLLTNTGNIAAGNITATGNTSVGNLTVSGQTALGVVGNVSITGGNIGEVLSTDGAGNLSWTPNPIYTVPPVYLVAPTAGNNQVFSNTILASYTSNTEMTVFYNGALLENTYYTLSGDEITVNIPLQTGDGIDVVTTVAATVNSIVSSGYGNSNVAAYLPSYTGALTSLVADVTTTANVNASIVNATDINATTLSLGTGNLQLTDNIISSTADTITIDPLGDGTPAGNVVVSGNLQVSGNITYNDIVNATTTDLQWIAANDAASASLATGGGLSVGPAGIYAQFTYNAGSNVWQSSLPLLANGGVNANGALSGATTGLFSGNVTASYFIGNGSSLSQLTGANVTGTVASATVAASANSVAGANVSGQVANALVAGTVYTAAQPNITSVGTLTTLAITGNVTGGNINTSGNINFSVAEGSNTDTARIFANVTAVGNFTSLIMEVSDDIEDNIILRHKSFDTGNTVNMLTAQMANGTQANVTVTGNLIATNRVTATNIGNVAAINLNGNSAFYLSGTGTWGVPNPQSVTAPILFSASGSAPTKATSTQSDWITLQDDRTGWCTVQFQYVATNPSGAAGGSGIYYISLPSGYRFDLAFHRTDNSTSGTVDPQMATKIVAGSTGFVSWGTLSVPVSGILAIIPVNDSSFKMITPQAIGANGASNWSVVSSGYFNLNGGGGNYSLAASFRFKKAD